MNKKIINVILLSSILVSLSSCAAVLVGGTAAIAGTSVAIATDARGGKKVLDDGKLDKRLEKSLNTSPDFRRSDVNVIVYNNNVLLVGRLYSAEVTKTIMNELDKYKINKVYDYTSIGKKLGMSDNSSDGWITTQVKAKLLAAKYVHSNDIKVVTYNKVVYLLGLVDKHEASIAATSTSEIKNVDKVVVLFDYSDSKQKVINANESQGK